ncbi:MAG: 2-dehydropantoate 2-reductase [Cephaloticoccus sp.]|nr:2-dehydropantoate 2-reductase [Akkermansiaceae bacterium]MCF7761283.1 2-dehydropantoate 2-reductase [Cephaloticoccus sp.]
MARIAIIGPGAIGGVIAAQLHRLGRHEILLCARTALARLQVETPDGPITMQPTVLTDPAGAPPVDWVLITTKAYDASGAARWFDRLCAEGAPVAILQNGVEHRERFAPFLPVDRLLPVIVDLPAERRDPAHIQQRGRGLLTVTDDAQGREFAELFDGTPLEVTLTADFKSVAWRKLCLNSVGIINALLQQPTGIFREDSIAELADKIAQECLVVGRAEGAVLEESLPQDIVQRCRNAPPDAVNSLHGDRLAGRPMELAARNGVIVRLGKKHGIPTPCNEMAVTLLTMATRTNGSG